MLLVMIKSLNHVSINMEEKKGKIERRDGEMGWEERSRRKEMGWEAVGG